MTGDAQPLVDVVVVAYRSSRHLPALSAALTRQSCRDWRLIVWDNASPEHPAQAADLPSGALLVSSKDNLGFAAGNNRAAALGRAPFLAFLNPDAFPEPDWLQALLEAARRWPQAAAFGSAQIRAEESTRWDGLGDVLFAAGVPYRAAYGKPRRGPPPQGETFSACAAAMLVRREAFEAVGGFDEDLFCFGEDVDLGFRLRLAGAAVVQVAGAVVAHVGGASTGRRSDFADFHGVRNRLWVFVKNMPGPLFWPLLPLHLALSLILLACYPLSGRGLAGWRGFLAGLHGLPAVWRKRRTVQRGRCASCWRIAQALAWSPLVLLSRAPVIRPIRESA